VVNLAEVREVARLRVVARRADSTTSKLQAQLQDMQDSMAQLKAKVSEHKLYIAEGRLNHQQAASSGTGHAGQHGTAQGKGQ
jgi:Skp family chaperone for outer membrane proteins